jgi:ferric-dicitrate binding protein FerR (iron transport regulator)
LLAALSVGFTSMAQSSTVLSGAEQQQVAKVLEHDAEVVSNTQLEKQLAGQPQKTQDEIIRINTQARHIALQVALLIPILAGLIGLLISFRMMRLPDPRQSGSGEQAVLG